MFSRATSIPAYTSSRIRRGDEVAGPRVQTIFALRTSLSLAPDFDTIQTTRDSTRSGRCPTVQAQTTSGRSVGLIGAGRVVEPVRYASTAAAAARPSAIAQTISDCPRPASPATKTPGTEDVVGHVARDVAALVEVDAELLDQARLLRAGEAHREEHQLGRDLALGALDLGELAALEDHVDQAQRPDVAVLVAEELLGGHGVDPLAALLVGRGDAERHRVRRPRLARRAATRRLGHDLELRDRGRALTGRGAEAVRAGVAAADDDDVLAGRR